MMGNTVWSPLRRGCFGLICAGLLAWAFPARGEALSGSLLLVWRELPPKSWLTGVTPAAAGFETLRLIRLTPLFPGHLTPGDPLARFWRIDLSPGADAAEVRARLALDPRVAGVEEDRVIPLSGCLPDDPYFLHPAPDSTQWGLLNSQGPDLHAIDAWNVTTGDSTLIIGNIDSGTDWHHPEFGSDPGPGGTIALNAAEYSGRPGVDDDGNGFVDDIRGWDFVDLTGSKSDSSTVARLEDGYTPDNDPNDYDGHGTFVAGIMVARMDDGRGIAGVAPGCRVLPLRAGWRQDYVDDSGRRVVRGVISMAFCAQSIVYAADNGARVLNCSWESDSTAALKAALDYAIGVKGVVVVDAATNGGGSETQIRNYLSRRGDCIEVCAIDRKGFIVPQSSVGRWVDLSAPGDGIVSLASASFGRDYSVYGGATSWAAPFVSGVAALLLSAEPGLDGPAVRRRLQETATNLDDRNGIYGGKIGAGFVNAAAALRAAVVNPASTLASVPATPPAWLADGDAVFTTAGGWLVRVQPRSAAVDSFPLYLSGPLGGAAYGVVDGAPVLGLTFGRGQVGLFASEGARLAGWPRPTGGLLPGGPVIVDGGRVFVAGTDSLLYGWDPEGRTLAGFPIRLSDASLAAPAVGDVERDGRLDLAVITADGRLALFTDEGRLRGGWPRETGSTGRVAPLLGDLDADGRLDVVIADESGRVSAWSAAGVPLSGWPRSLGGAVAGEPALADLDADDRAEVIVARSDRLFVLTGTGSDRSGWPVGLPATPVGGALAGHVAPGSGPRQVVLGLATGCALAYEASGARVVGWPKRLSGPLAAPPALLPGGGPFDPRLVAITMTGRLESFQLPSDLDGPVGAWGSLGGDPGRTRTLAATAPIREPGEEPGDRPTALLFAPNPFQDGTGAVTELPRGGPIEVVWFTITGRQLRRDTVQAPAGRVELRWDGRDALGGRVPPGVYLFRVKAGDRIQTGRVLRLP